jgi:hypothetical protein
MDAADPDVVAADPGVAAGAVVEAADPDVDVAEAEADPDVDVVVAAAGPDVADCVVVAVFALGAAGPDVADCVVVAVAAAAGPDVAVVVAAPRASGAVLLPIARKMSHNTRCRCDEETYCMLGKHGHHASAKPR